MTSEAVLFLTNGKIKEKNILRERAVVLPPETLSDP